jgi:hypothetical protein
VCRLYGGGFGLIRRKNALLKLSGSSTQLVSRWDGHFRPDEVVQKGRGLEFHSGQGVKPT